MSLRTERLLVEYAVYNIDSAFRGSGAQLPRTTIDQLSSQPTDDAVSCELREVGPPHTKIAVTPPNKR